jgi:gamma-glutamylcyclotransferase (GGCT)/AIG2-like uncharacterized protein YtfP
MFTRCPNSVLIGPGYLHDHRLYFGSYAQSWGGAVADVVPSEEPGTSVPVLIYELPQSDLEMLDEWEGYPVKYKRKQSLVTLKSGKRVKAWVYYLAPAHEGKFGAPSEKYFQQIRRAYLRFRLNEEYLNKARHVSEELGKAIKVHELGHDADETDSEFSALLNQYADEDTHTAKDIDDIFSEFEED